MCIKKHKKIVEYYILLKYSLRYILYQNKFLINYDKAQSIKSILIRNILIIFKNK